MQGQGTSVLRWSPVSRLHSHISGALRYDRGERHTMTISTRVNRTPIPSSERRVFRIRLDVHDVLVLVADEGLEVAGAMAGEGVDLDEGCGRAGRV